MSAATRLRRLDEDVEVVVLERSGNVSFANCGLPYYVGGVIEDEDDLKLQTPESLFERFRLDVRVNSEVVSIDREAREVVVRDTRTGDERREPYDRLVLSTGAAPIRPPIPGYERVRTLRTVEDAATLAADVDDTPASAVVVGAGFIGLEVAENLVRRGVAVTVVEAAPQVLAPLDAEMAVLVSDELERNGIDVITGVGVSVVGEDGVTLADGRTLAADLVVGAIGVRPEVNLAVNGDLRLGPLGGIAVDAFNRTSDPFVYAVGDAAEKVDAVSDGASLIALANVANRQGRRVADHIAGRKVASVGSLGPAIVKVFDVVAASVGWNERRLREAGRPYRSIHSHPFNHATYYPGAQRMSLKLLFDPSSGEILGAQAVGRDGVDKRIDVIATAMAGRITADGLADLELAYAPPFSSAKDPVNMLGYMAENVIAGDCDVVDAAQVPELIAQGWTLLDVRTPAEQAATPVAGTRSLPLDDIRGAAADLVEAKVIVMCEVGQRGHTATALLREMGVEARNLDGGRLTLEASRRAGLLQSPG